MLSNCCQLMFTSTILPLPFSPSPSLPSPSLPPLSLPPLSLPSPLLSFPPLSLPPLLPPSLPPSPPSPLSPSLPSPSLPSPPSPLSPSLQHSTADEQLIQSALDCGPCDSHMTIFDARSFSAATGNKIMVRWRREGGRKGGGGWEEGVQ